MRGLFAGCWQQAALRALSARDTRRESVPITDLLKPLTHNDLQIDLDTNVKVEICNCEKRSTATIAEFSGKLCCLLSY